MNHHTRAYAATATLTLTSGVITAAALAAATYAILLIVGAA